MRRAPRNLRLIRGLALLAGVLVPLWLMAAEGDPLRPPAVQTQSVPPVPPELAERLRQYQSVRSAEFRGWAPDGRGILVQTRFGETAQLHRVYEPGGRREQITFFDEPVDGRFIPKSDDDLLVAMSIGGSEKNQIYRYDPDNGRTLLLTDGTSRNILGPVSEDGETVLIASNQRNERDTDLYIAETDEPRSMELVLETDGEYWIAEDIARDGTRALINHYVSINESYPAVLNLKTGKMTPIQAPVPEGRKVAYTELSFAPDGKSVYLAADLRGEFLTLARVDLEREEYTWLTIGTPWDVSEIEVGPSTGHVAFAVNEGGTIALYLLHARPLTQPEPEDPPAVVSPKKPPIPPFARGGKKPQRVELPPGLVSFLEFSPDGKRLGFTLERPDAPADAYSVDLKTGRLTRWTYSEVGGLDPSTFVVPEKITFESFDGREIPAFYYRPPGASKDDPVPVVVSIHGGPESQYRPKFSGFEQFLVNELGVAVVAPNVRGSAGYGKSYLRLDNAEKREDSVKDIGALLDWIARQPELDEDRVAVMGGSYGGYMVLSALTNFPERIKAGVDIVGIASFQTFLQNTSPYRQDLRRAEYGDERDPEMRAFFQQIDPLAHAEKIRAALLVAHGKNDPRVPFSEAQQIAEEVRAGGRDVWTLYADNEGHGFAKKANRDYLTAVIALFLKEHLF